MFVHKAVQTTQQEDDNMDHQEPLLLRWNNFNPGIDK